MEQNKYAKIENLPYQQRWAFDKVLDVVDEYNKKIDELNAKLNAALDFKPAKPLKNHLWKTEIHNKVWSEQKYLSYAGKYSDSVPLMTVDQIKSIREKDLLIYEENKIIAAENQKSLNVTMTLLLKLGLKRTKTERISSRSVKTREVEQSWVSEVTNAFPINADWNWKLAEDTYKAEIQKIEKYEKDSADKKAKAELAAAAALKEQEKDVLIIRLVEKYKLEFSVPIPEPDDVLEKLLKRNKYLYLAHYLLANRNDWHDGYSYAKTGLNNFIIESPLDAEIDADVRSYFEDFSDGRVWRDSQWNYNALYCIVKESDPTLYEDYQKLKYYVG